MSDNDNELDPGAVDLEATDQDSDDEDMASPADGEESADALDSEGDIAADYLEELLDIADLDGDIDTYVEGDRAHISIVTDSDLLVGKDGEVLDALQELARLSVLTETGRHSRLMLDVAGFREKRRQQLQQLALDAVNEVKVNGEAVRLAPMNPFERKIVHDVAAANGLYSESEGVEPQRRVVISSAQ
jgi:spoIIIJ-associated protein